MRKSLRVMLLVPLLLLSSSVWAVAEVREFDNTAQEVRYQELTEELRCTVCQNQNIAGSNAELAADLRNKTYQMVREGKTKDEIKDFMVARYGNFVLYEPPVTPGTLLLWIGPFLFFVFGGWLLVRLIRRRRDQTPATVDEAHLRRAAALLSGKEDPKA